MGAEDMNKKKFEALMIFLVPDVVTLIAERDGIDQQEATRRFYASEVYSLLSNEETKLWHYSPLTLYHMYKNEIETGSINFPEGI
jgi:hypothetical protein